MRTPALDAPPGVADNLKEIFERLDDLGRRLRDLDREYMTRQDIEDLRGELIRLTTKSNEQDDNDVFRASGAAHALGLVPDPGSSAGTAKYLREDATWVQPPASGIVNTPAGAIAATDVQAAINELDTEKLAVAGGTVSGDLTVSGYLLGKRKAAHFAQTSSRAGAGYYIWDTQSSNDSYEDGSIYTRQNSNQEIKITESGLYLIAGQFTVYGIASGQTDIELRAGVGGGATHKSQAVAATSGYGSGSLLVLEYFAANAVLAIYEGSGSAFNRYGEASGLYTRLAILRLA